ncbi:HNH endonuclease signature motif containing protein [Microcoleus sp. BROC3]
MPLRVSKLLKAQKSKCTHCALYFIPTDLVEVDRIIAKLLRGKHTYDNLQLLHRHCHDTKTANDGSMESQP